MNKEEKAIVLAMCLGDGYIGKNSTLYIEHSQNQEDYVKYKYNLLNKIFPTRHPNNLYYRQRLDSRTGKIYKQVSCHKYSKYFRVLRKWLYTPTKIFKRKLLDRLTPEAIAIWYMDDGCLRCRESTVTGKVTSIQVILSTHCSLEEAEMIRDYFQETWGIVFSIYKQKNKYLHCANTENGNKFLDLVRPHVIPSMSYKVNIISKSARLLSKSKDEDIV